MSREKNGHSSHHHKKHVIMDFLVRIFDSIGFFFYRLFRPARHFFRALRRASRRIEDKFLEVCDDIEFSRSRRKDIRIKRRLKKREERSARLKER